MDHCLLATPLEHMGKEKAVPLRPYPRSATIFLNRKFYLPKEVSVSTKAV